MTRARPPLQVIQLRNPIAHADIDESRTKLAFNVVR
jgi:hypothetical protein